MSLEHGKKNRKRKKKNREREMGEKKKRKEKRSQGNVFPCLVCVIAYRSNTSLSESSTCSTVTTEKFFHLYDHQFVFFLLVGGWQLLSIN